MDPKILEMRKAAAARYKNTPESEKPHIKICDDCGVSIYDSKICKTTGKLHEHGKQQLVGGKLVDADKKTMTTSELINAINAIRVRWEKARVTKLSIDQQAMGIFQSVPIQREWQLMRYGIMYGTVSADGTAVTVDCIYEPEQEGTNTDWTLLEDKREEHVDMLAKGLGLRRVGVCVTHQPRDPKQCVLTGRELLALAKDQSRYGDHCCLVTLGPSHENQGIEAQAWQGSQQAVNLYQLGLFSESGVDIRYIKSSTPLEIAQDTKDEKGHSKCVIKEPEANVDTRWMTAPVAVSSFETTVIRNTFARISRPGEIPPTMANLKNYFADPRRTRLPFVERIADFHVLIFLMEAYFTPSGMPLILQAVLAKDNDAVQVYDETIKDHFKQL